MIQNKNTSIFDFETTHGGSREKIKTENVSNENPISGKNSVYMNKLFSSGSKHSSQL